MIHGAENYDQAGLDPPGGRHRPRPCLQRGTAGRWSADALIARDTDLTRPLADPAYFRGAFIEAGALCWPNGLELSAPGLHRRLDEAGKLSRDAA